MQRFWQYLYSYALLPLLWTALHLAGLFKEKVRRGILGRKRLFSLLAKHMTAMPPGTRFWFHSSSMGEFEQAKPIIALLKQSAPDTRIIVTFFSPSGYEHSKNYPLADVISYLPFDTLRGARRFLDLVRPDVAVMVRYDIWPNHIWELHRRNIPVLIANATMRRQTARRLPLIRNFHHHVYNALDTILTVSATDAQAFAFFGLTHPRVEVIGDTRYDQVIVRSAEARQRHLIPSHVLRGKKVVVVGSSWPEDEEVVLPALFQIQQTVPDILLILVPHEPTIEHLEDLEHGLAGKASSIRFSALNEYRGEAVIIVDSIGILLPLYAYAHIAYVGGSFRQGVHNVLEAAVYGMPVIFGPRHRNSQEPLMMLDHGGGFVISNSEELQRALHNLLEDEDARLLAGKRAAAFVQSRVGATQRVVTTLKSSLRAHQELHAE